MKITAYNQHDVGSSHEPWSCSSQPNLLATGQRRMQSTAARNLGEPREASHFCDAIIARLARFLTLTLPSSKSLRSALSIPDSPSRLLLRISETSPRPLRGLFPPHR